MPLYHIDKSNTTSLHKKNLRQPHSDIHSSPYLFHNDTLPHQFHPIQEYYYEDTTTIHTTIHTNNNADKSSTLTFILEVTWPRVVLFYHASSHACRAFLDAYVHTARQIKHQSTRTVVDFWAVSCEVYGEACEDLEIHQVPTLLAFPAGKIQGLVLHRTGDNRLSTRHVAETLGVELQQQQQHHHDEEEQTHSQDKQNLPVNNFVGDTKDHSTTLLLHPQHHPQHHDTSSSSSSLLNDVYRDAMASFLYSIHSSVQRDVETNQLIPWSPPQLHALQEWLDLLHWSLPSRDLASLHNVVNDLRNNLKHTTNAPAVIGRVLASHDYYRNGQALQTWSDSCRRTSNGDNNGELACGFWKLLHVMSIGVVEQHSKVMGDLNRVLVPHVMTTVRNYIHEFGFGENKEARDCLLQSYQECQESDACRETMGLLRQTTFSSTWWHRPHVPAPNDPSWRNMALWLWRVHNEYRTRRLAVDEKGSDALLSVHGTYWPPVAVCEKCHDGEPRALDDEDKHDMSATADGVVWDLQAVYNHIHHEYWPKTIQSPRLVVLDRWGTRRHFYTMLFYERFARATERFIGGAVVCCIILLLERYCLSRWYRFRHSGRHKKDRYDIDEYLADAPIRHRTRRPRRRSATGNNSRLISRVPRPLLDR